MVDGGHLDPRKWLMRRKQESKLWSQTRLAPTAEKEEKAPEIYVEGDLRW